MSSPVCRHYFVFQHFIFQQGKVNPDQYAMNMGSYPKLLALLLPGLLACSTSSRIRRDIASDGEDPCSRIFATSYSQHEIFEEDPILPYWEKRIAGGIQVREEAKSDEALWNLGKGDLSTIHFGLLHTLITVAGSFGILPDQVVGFANSVAIQDRTQMVLDSHADLLVSLISWTNRKNGPLVAKVDFLVIGGSYYVRLTSKNDTPKSKANSLSSDGPPLDQNWIEVLNKQFHHQALSLSKP